MCSKSDVALEKECCRHFSEMPSRKTLSMDGLATKRRRFQFSSGFLGVKYEFSVFVCVAKAVCLGSAVATYS